MTTRTLTAVVHREGYLYVAQCPEVGTVSQGVTTEDARANLEEAIGLYLEEFPSPEISEILLTTTSEATCTETPRNLA